MAVDPARLNLVAYGGDAFASPVAPRAVDALLARTDLRPTDRALELGCGHGQLAEHLVRRGLTVVAVERYASVANAARARLAGLPAEVLTAEATDVLSSRAGFDLVAAVGAGGIAGRDPGPGAVLRALGRAAAPGGWVLWGETFRLGEPSPRLRMFAEIGGGFGAFHEHVSAGEGAGLVHLRSEQSPVEEWDAYVSRYVRNVETWSAANPLDPQGPHLLSRARAWRDLYRDEARGVMGFGLHLFQKPGERSSSVERVPHRGPTSPVDA